METKIIHDKKFAISITAKELQLAVTRLANQINNDLASKEVLFIGILNGSFMFASDLFKKVDLNCRISFVKTAFYEGTQTSDEVVELIGLNEVIKDKTIVLIEDIVDTGNTLDIVIKNLEQLMPSEIKIATLLFKPDAYGFKRKPDYVGFRIPDRFVVGYGLDYDGLGRNLEDIYTEVE